MSWYFRSNEATGMAMVDISRDISGRPMTGTIAAAVIRHGARQIIDELPATDSRRENYLTFAGRLGEALDAQAAEAGSSSGEANQFYIHKAELPLARAAMRHAMPDLEMSSTSNVELGRQEEILAGIEDLAAVRGV
jgi:hypothetical protein